MGSLARGHLYLLEGSPGTGKSLLTLLIKRAKATGIDLDALRASGNLLIEQVDAAQVKTVVIDSLNGYQAAMPEEHSLLLHMHELLQYLNRQGATTCVTVAQHGLVGDMQSPVHITYLADSVILLRYFEAMGRVRRAISVIKKRSGPHEDSMRRPHWRHGYCHRRTAGGFSGCAARRADLYRIGQSIAADGA